MNSLVPLLAMVPRLSMASWRDRPMPLSVMVSVRAALSKTRARPARAGLRTGRVVERLETQLVAGVGRVRDQLAQEDFLVGIQRVRDEVQQLRDFGLEGEFGRPDGRAMTRCQLSQVRPLSA
jgi:hypothetical protein